MPFAAANWDNSNVGEEELQQGQGCNRLQERVFTFLQP